MLIFEIGLWVLDGIVGGVFGIFGSYFWWVGEFGVCLMCEWYGGKKLVVVYCFGSDGFERLFYLLFFEDWR